MAPVAHDLRRVRIFFIGHEVAVDLSFCRTESVVSRFSTYIAFEPDGYEAYLLCRQPLLAREHGLAFGHQHAAWLPRMVSSPSYTAVNGSCSSTVSFAIMRIARHVDEMAQTPLDESSLAPFLTEFYGRVRGDPLIGPLFAAAITDADWPRHMATIESFWSSILFKTGRYKGNPFGKHQRLRVLHPEHFVRWLELFHETASACFLPLDAAVVQQRAEQIGDSLKSGLFFRPGAHDSLRL